MVKLSLTGLKIFCEYNFHAFLQMMLSSKFFFIQSLIHKAKADSALMMCLFLTVVTVLAFSQKLTGMVLLIVALSFFL